jgi:two-component sensor histidine kinase
MSPPIRQSGTIPGLSRAVSGYVWAALAVGVVFAARLAVQPVLQQAPTYSLFYPAVVALAYVFGRRPAALAMVASALLSHICLATPQFAWKGSPSALISLFFFVANASVAIALITALNRALDRLAAGQSRAEAVADSHADLFRELNERISHHLRLVAGVLTLQAKGEPEAEVMRSLRKASERSMLMVRVHRELAGRKDEPVDFDAFARGLVRSVCQARGEAADRVEIEPAGLWLPPDEATSLGVALAECVAALLARKDSGPLRIRMLRAGAETRLTICELDPASGASIASVSSGYLLRAMVEQLGAAVALKADAQGSSLEITVPHFAPPAADAAKPPAAGMLH